MSNVLAIASAKVHRARAAAVESQYSFCDQPPTLGGSNNTWPLPAIAACSRRPDEATVAGATPNALSAPTTYSVGCVISPLRAVSDVKAGCPKMARNRLAILRYYPETT